MGCVVIFNPFGPVETVGEWKARKRAQATRFMERDPALELEDWQDYGTKFVLIHRKEKSALVIGCLPRDDIEQSTIDVGDEQIADWLFMLGSQWHPDQIAQMHRP